MSPGVTEHKPSPETSPIPIDADRTPYGKSVTIASTEFFKPEYTDCDVAAGSSSNDANANVHERRASAVTNFVSLFSFVSSFSARRHSRVFRSTRSCDPSALMPSSLLRPKYRHAAPLADINASSQTSPPITSPAPSAKAANATAPPPTHGSTTTSPNLTRAAFTASTACSGGIAFGASIVRNAVCLSMPQATTSPNMFSGWT